MITDISEWGDAIQDFDLAIVGSGVAGLTLAFALRDSGLRVLVLEAGGRQASAASQMFYKGSVADGSNHPPPDRFRVRALGGTSRIWGGRTVPLDPIDFEARAWVDHSGWPIPFDSINKYYPAANAVLEAGAFQYQADAPLIPGFDSELFATTYERFSRPTNLWTRFGAALTASPKVYVAVNAPVATIGLSADGRSVDRLEVARPDGRRVTVRCARYVLAMGAIETARLLLASNGVRPKGVGNSTDWVGRTYMAHIAAVLGRVTFDGSPKAITFGYERDAEKIYMRRRLWLTPKAQRQNHLLNTVLRLSMPDQLDPSHGNPVLSLMHVAAFLGRYEYTRRSREAKIGVASYLRHLWNMASQPITLTTFVADWVLRRYLSERRIPSPIIMSKTNTYALEVHAEQAPNRDSRVTLAGDQDAFGVPRVLLDWRAAAIDIESVEETFKLLDLELRRTNTGRLTLLEQSPADDVRSSGAYGGHHLGTARMAETSISGVVDGNCRVFETDNLWICGGAVFPTSGQANPTLTIAAMALRMADHLSQLAGRQSVHADRHRLEETQLARLGGNA